MRIGLVTERMLNGFGVDLVIDQLASGLSRRGHEVTVYSSQVDGTYDHRPYRIHRVPISGSRWFPVTERRAHNWAPLIDDRGHDAVQIHTFPFFSLIPRLRTPTVAVDHGVSLTVGMPAWLRADFAYMSWTLYRRYLPHATEVVTISDYLRRHMPARLAERVKVVPWGSEHYCRPVTSAEVSAYRRGLGIPDDAVLGLYVGRLNHEGQPYKGVAELLGHFQALRAEGLPVALLCIGYGNQADAATIRRAGGTPVLLAPPEEMPLAYTAADLLVSCSHWEGFGLPLIEAQRFGTPALAYAVGGHPEIARPGETAVLVDGPGRFRDEWRALVREPERRRSLGVAAQAYAAAFSWDRAVDAHEAILAAAAATKPRRRPAAAGARSVSGSGDSPLVSVIVLTYEPEREHLAPCLDSVLASDYPNIELLVVDNRSRNRVAAELAAERARVRLIETGRNGGFSAGINRGVRESNGSLLLLLNPDAQVERNTIGVLVDAARRRPDAVGFAPMMVFAHDTDVIDSIGTCIDSQGAAFNRGIGQVDIGQYGLEEPVMGACFGAAMIRAEAFEPHRVGPLDERYFLYFEDVDWCLRATLEGGDFWSVPNARVRHVHSATTRNQHYGFKYRLIERNLMYTVFKNLEKRRVLRIFARRSMAHARNVLRGRFAKESVQILVESWLGVLRYWRERELQQKRRTRADLDAIKLGFGEMSYFSPVDYAPEYQWETVYAMLQRLYVVTGEERWERGLSFVRAAMETSLRFRPVELRHGLAKIAGPLPRPLVKFLDRLNEQPGMVVRLETTVAPVAAAEDGDRARTA